MDDFNEEGSSSTESCTWLVVAKGAVAASGVAAVTMLIAKVSITIVCSYVLEDTHDKGRDDKEENLGVNNDEDDEQEQVVLFVTQC